MKILFYLYSSVFTFDLYMHMNGVYQWGYKDETSIYRSCYMCAWWVPTKTEQFWHHESMKHTHIVEKNTVWNIGCLYASFQLLATYSISCSFYEILRTHNKLRSRACDKIEIIFNDADAHEYFYWPNKMPLRWSRLMDLAM